MIDERVERIVDLAKNSYPHLFKTKEKKIKACEGRHGDQGYCNFWNKGTGYAYCLYAKNSNYFLSIWVTEATRKNEYKNKKAMIHEENFIVMFQKGSKNILSKIEKHKISKKPSYIKRVDVSNINDETIVDWMAKLTSEN